VEVLDADLIICFGSLSGDNSIEPSLLLRDENNAFVKACDALDLSGVLKGVRRFIWYYEK
jgi:hypothetical protein